MFSTLVGVYAFSVIWSELLLVVLRGHQCTSARVPESGICVYISGDMFCVLRVCELFGETIRNMFGGVCYFVVECDGVVECGWKCSIR